MAPGPNSIATLVIGPQAGGRGYRVLARSDGGALADAAEGRLNELALVLAGWADENDAPAAALVPLADATAPALLMRFAYLGTASLGTIAFAHGLILDAAAFALCAGRPERLLPLIPPPDGSRHFADTALSVPNLRPAPCSNHDWSGLGLEWRDRLIMVDRVEDEEPALVSVLASIPPAGPGARVRGWATTALLPSSGSFSPSRELQLLVVGADRRVPAGLHHLPARVTPSAFEGERLGLTPVAQAWQRLKSLGTDDVEVAEAVLPLRWLPEHLNASPAEVVEPAARQALGRLSGGGAQVRFILDLARPRGHPLDPLFAATARSLLDQLLGRDQLEPQHAAFYIKALADGPPVATAALGPLGKLLLKPGTAEWLRGPTFERLMELGWAAALVDRADEAPDLLKGINGDEAVLLLQRALGGDLPLRTPPIISSLLRELAERSEEDEDFPPSWSRAYSAALRWRMSEAPGADERLLGSRAVVRATFRSAETLMAPLARRALHLQGATSAREKVDMLGGALEWVRRQGAAA